MRFIQFVLLFFVILSMAACSSSPEVIKAKPQNKDIDISALNDAVKDTKTDEDQHKVVVKEVLNTDKYSYLKVDEKGDEYWIAILRADVTVGDTYYYKGGLKKKNFPSREFDRVFERLILVSNVWKQPVAGETAAEAHQHIQTSKVEAPVNITPAKGAVTIGEILKNPSKYDGKKVIVTGKCVKFNPMIMKKNWVHLKDGTTDEGDLTITTTENVGVGSVVTLEGTIVINKDFGAGYKYDVLMEEAVLK